MSLFSTIAAAARGGAPPADEVDDRALIAHLLRRTSFGPLPGQVEALVPGGVAAAVDLVLRAVPQDPGPPPQFSSDLAPPSKWLGLMGQPTAGLHEKMVWYWHGHLTSSQAKVVNWPFMYNQQLLFRAMALGDFRSLMQAITVDPAMLVYLDGAGSLSAAPNENYGREVMELFTLGRDRYTQLDVEAGAYALSGWDIDYATSTAVLDTASGPQHPVDYLGRSVASAPEVIDTICDDPDCPRWITTGLFEYFVGRAPTAPELSAHASAFAHSGLDIAVLVESIIRDPAFMAERMSRPRYPVEWVVAGAAAYGIGERTEDLLSACVALDQIPYAPPNVAGWPNGPVWLSASFMSAHSHLAIAAADLGPSSGAAAVQAASDPVAAALERCSLYEVTAGTRAALEQANDALDHDPSVDDLARATIVLGLAATSPEMTLA